MRRPVIVGILLMAPLGCREPFDLDQYLVGVDESGSESVNETETDASTTETETETETDTNEATATGSETDTDTETETGDVECAPGELDLGGVCLSMEATYELGAQAPSDLELAQFDGVGGIDVALAGSPVSVRYNLGDGDLSVADAIDGTSSTRLAAGDLNNDGKAEIVTFSQTEIQIHQFAGANFIALDTFALTGFDAIVGDIDGDNTPDLVISGSTLKQILNDDGTYTIGTEFPIAGQALDFIDLDGDTTREVVLAMPGGSAAAVFDNEGAGLQSVMEVEIGHSASDIAGYDIDGDGLDEILVTSSDGTLRVYNFSLDVLDTIAIGTEPRAIAVGDIDQDGLLDVAVTDGEGHSIVLLLNTGTWLGPPVALAAEEADYPESIGMADLDDDGFPEIVVGMIITNRLVVFG